MGGRMAKNTASTSRSRTLRSNMTDVERKLWKRLRAGQIHGAHFRRQSAIGDYIADFARFEPRIVVELDGGQHAEQAMYDATRTAWLESRGFAVLRFWNNEVLENLDGIVEAIGRAVFAASPPP